MLVIIFINDLNEELESMLSDLKMTQTEGKKANIMNYIMEVEKEKPRLTI